MLTIAGGILAAYGILITVVVGGGIVLGIISIPFGFARLIWISKRKKPLPVRHYFEELPDHLGGSDGW